MSLPYCRKCNRQMQPGESYLNVLGGTYHSNCFSCTKCNAPIGTQQFYNINNQPYCRNCHSTHDVPNCTTCGQPLTRGSDFLKYEGQSYHTRCFICNECRTPLGDRDFFKHQGGRYCQNCIDRVTTRGGGGGGASSGGYSSGGGGGGYSSGGSGGGYSSGGGGGGDFRSGGDFDEIAVVADTSGPVDGGDFDAPMQPFDDGMDDFSASISEPVMDDFGGGEMAAVEVIDDSDVRDMDGGDVADLEDALSSLDDLELEGNVASIEEVGGGGDFGGDDFGGGFDDGGDLDSMLEGLEETGDDINSNYGLEEDDKQDLYDALSSLDDLDLDG